MNETKLINLAYDINQARAVLADKDSTRDARRVANYVIYERTLTIRAMALETHEALVRAIFQAEIVLEGYEDSKQRYNVTYGDKHSEREWRQICDIVDANRAIVRDLKLQLAELILTDALENGGI